MVFATEHGRVRKLNLVPVPRAEHLWSTSFTPTLWTLEAAGERVRFDYADRSAWADILTGDDGVMSFTGDDGKVREGTGWTEGERLEIHLRDRDFVQALMNQGSLDLSWYSGRLTRRETIPLQLIQGDDGERRIVMVLPDVTNIDSQTRNYSLTVTYHDLIGASGFQGRLVEKTIFVRAKIHPYHLKFGTWTRLGAVGNEELGVRLGDRKVHLYIRGGVYPERQEPLMTGSEGWLLFLDEQPERSEALARWLCRRTFLLIPNGLVVANAVKRETLLNTFGGPETGKVHVDLGADGSSLTISIDLVRPVGAGVLINALRFTSDGSQSFLAEPIMGDPFRGLMLIVE